jgi:hypothetical protein
MVIGNEAKAVPSGKEKVVRLKANRRGGWRTGQRYGIESKNRRHSELAPTLPRRSSPRRPRLTPGPAAAPLRSA